MYVATISQYRFMYMCTCMKQLLRNNVDIHMCTCTIVIWNVQNGGYSISQLLRNNYVIMIM